MLIYAEPVIFRAFVKLNIASIGVFIFTHICWYLLITEYYSLYVLPIPESVSIVVYHVSSQLCV
jgi:hypothetical protein